MNFDYSSVLTRAGQITWKHKSIWGLLILPMLVAFLPFVLFSIFFLIVMTITEGDMPEAMLVVVAIVLLLTSIISTVVNYAVRSASISAATLGIIRAERGEGSTKFMDLLRDGTPYFWRILGVMLVINLTLGLVFTVFFMLAFLLILVTIGMASICLQPIMILLTPLMFLMIGVLESAQIAVIAEDMKVMDAIKHALQVVRTHVWKYVIITLIIYFGSSILTSFIITPLMLPVFIVPFLIGLGQEMSMQSVALISVLFFCIFFPVMMLVSSVLGVFMKASLDITYLRLARPAEK
ncbi:MAG: hypothetical protein Q7T89_07400 [Anaerolineales bacterium]|nr:hypothetical protein [Anaerolineales bacterium]